MSRGQTDGTAAWAGSTANGGGGPCTGEMLPRILILTRWAPDARYAGGEDFRKRVGALPRDCLRWAYVARPLRDKTLPIPLSQAFPPRWLHWRLREGFMQRYYLNMVQAPRLARDIARWAADFRPQLAWIISDMEAVTVGRRVARRLGIPFHMSVPDAYESCRLFGVSRPFYGYYMREVRRALEEVTSVDAISAELLDHLKKTFRMPRLRDAMVYSAPVPRFSRKAASLESAPSAGSGKRSIGFCGASRVSDREWEAFLRLLAKLDWDFELIVFANPDFFHRTPVPKNVTLSFQPYQPTEDDLIRRFFEEQVCACYLGLWRDPDKALFARTSLSCKLTTYAAAALPVIVDAPEQSVAWRLVGDYGAGVLCGTDEAENLARLKRLFGDREAWWEMAQGSARLCRGEFVLETSTRRFKQLLRHVAG